MTLCWLIIYLVVSNGARHGGIIFNPINWWAGTFIAALGFDVFNLPSKKW